MYLMNLTHLAMLINMSIRILKRLTTEDRQHAHNMRIYPKICTSIKGHVYTSDRSLEYGSSIVAKGFPKISLIILGHIYG